MKITDNVVDLPCVTKLDIPPTKILAKAAGAKLKEVIVVGVDGDGDFYFASSKSDAADVIFWLEMAKKKLLEICDA